LGANLTSQQVKFIWLINSLSLSTGKFRSCHSC